MYTTNSRLDPRLSRALKTAETQRQQLERSLSLKAASSSPPSHHISTAGIKAAGATVVAREATILAVDIAIKMQVAPPISGLQTKCLHLISKALETAPHTAAVVPAIQTAAYQQQQKMIAYNKRFLEHLQKQIPSASRDKLQAMLKLVSHLAHEITLLQQGVTPVSWQEEHTENTSLPDHTVQHSSQAQYDDDLWDDL